MRKADFMTEFDRLCRGFKHESTPEQAEAWFALVSSTDPADWSTAVSMLLCAPKFPYRDAVLHAIDQAATARRARARQCERKQAERLVEEMAGGARLSPVLFDAIKACGSREQVRHYQSLVRANQGRCPLPPASQERELARLRAEEQAYTHSLAKLLPQLDQTELTEFMARYGPEVAA